MRILHALRGLEATSGISSFVVEVCNAQVQAGHDVVFVYQRSLERTFDEKVIVLNEGDLNCLGFKPDVVHIHAIWTPFSVRVMRWCVRNNIPFIVSTHGCLMPRVLQKGRLKKWVFLNFLLRPLLAKARCVHCTSEDEKRACEKVGLKNKFTVIPIGCDLPRLGGERKKEILFLGRVAEEKGLDLFLSAWNSIDHNGWRFLIAGPDWLDYQSKLEKQIKDENIKDVEFVGIADADKKDKLYRSASLFVLPSQNENFSIVVLDALAYGVPVICTKGTPWGCVAEKECGWWVEPNSVAALKDALSQALNGDSEILATMGLRGRNLAETEYSWAKVNENLINVYMAIHKEERF